MKHPIRRLACIVLIGSLIGFTIAWWTPIHSSIIKLGLLGSLSGIWGAILVLLWPSKIARVLLLGLPLASIAILAFWPEKPVDQEQLRREYLNTMLSYRGVEYVWGGETPRGIDCSGLPRRALREAMARNGLLTGNGTLVREALSQWWHDASAKALQEGHRQQLASLDTTGTIQTMPYDRLLAGDLAITDDGRHVMVFLGGEDWLQADPGIGRVALLNGRKSGNSWFEVPVHMFRWRRLDTQAGTL